MKICLLIAAVAVLIFYHPNIGERSIIPSPVAEVRSSISVIAVQDNAESKFPENASKGKSGKLDILFQLLLAARDESVAAKLEAQIWGQWLVSGDEKSDKLMDRAVLAMNTGSFGRSLEILNELVNHAPNHPEAWNKRATVFYLLHRYDESLVDIARVLSLEPRHFGAISGIALISLARGNKKAALDAYRRAILIYPLMRGAAAIIRELEQEVEGVRL